MFILKKGLLEDNTRIQIEDWSDDLSFRKYGSTLAVYPKSKVTLNGQFAPKYNKSFRCDFEFNSHDEALKAFQELINNVKNLKDFELYLNDPKLKVCI